MKKNFVYPALIITNSILLTSCASPFVKDSITSVLDTASVEDSSVAKSNTTIYTQNEQNILDLYAQKEQDILSEDEYVTLASLLETEGYIKDARDVYEEAIRIYSDESLITAHDALVVNAHEEDESVISLLSSLETDDITKALSIIENDSFKNTLMPVLCDGKRTYYLDNLILEIGYTETGLYYTNVYSNSYTISVEGNITKIQTAEDSDFTLFTIDFNSGCFRIDKGSFVNGNLTGDYSVSIGLFDDYNNIKASEIYSDFESYSLEEYTGSFDEDGKSTLEAPNNATVKSLLKSTETEAVLVYAYNEDKTNCLYVGLSEDEASNYTFTEDTLGYVNAPEINTYEVKDSLLSASSPVDLSNEESSLEIRVYDGHIQVYDGNEWIDMGEVETYTENDPFKSYSEHKETVERTVVPQVTESGLSSSSGTVVEEKKVTASSSSSSKNSSSATASAATQQATTQASAGASSTPASSTPSSSTPTASTPAASTPSTPAASESSSSGSSGSQDTGSSDSDSSDSGSSDSGGNDGQDITIPDWTDDETSNED